MSTGCLILLLEDEPLILMDLEFAAEDRGCEVLSSPTSTRALALIEAHGDAIDVAILDVSLGEGSSCVPVARILQEHGIPYLLHSGDLDRHDEQVRKLEAQLIAKPAEASSVISAAIKLTSWNG